MQELKQFWALSIQEGKNPIDKLIRSIEGIGRYKRAIQYHIDDDIQEYKELTGWEEPTALDFYKSDPSILAFLEEKQISLNQDIKGYEMYVDRFKQWLKYNPQQLGTQQLLWAIYKKQITKSEEFDLAQDWELKRRELKHLEFEILSINMFTGKGPKDNKLADFKWKVEHAKQTPLIEVAQTLGVELRRVNGKWCCNCIFHSEDTPSLFFYEGSNKFKCYGCGEHGDAINLVMKVHNMDFKQAVIYLSGNV